MKNTLLYAEETFALRGAIFEVYREMGQGFLEAVYQECLERELHLKRIPFEAHKPLRLFYKQTLLEQAYIPDIICYNAIIIEIKAVNQILPEHKAQTFNYLKTTGLRLGLLVIFGSQPQVEIERLIR